MDETTGVPAVLPLLREDDDGDEQLAGWLFVLDREVVSYVSDSDTGGHAFGVFSSVESAARLLDYGGLLVTSPLPRHAGRSR